MRWAAILLLLAIAITPTVAVRLTTRRTRRYGVARPTRYQPRH